VDVAVKRWQAFTGLEAELAALWRSSGDVVSRGWSDAQKRAYVIADRAVRRRLWPGRA
jgi:hypothetical protein